MSVDVGKILGIKIRIHYTWILIFFLITWSLAVGYMPSQFPGLDSTVYWIIGAVSALSLFISVLVHELAHSYVALKQGLRVPSITLFLFGGVSKIMDEPETPGREAKMAFIGPLSSFAIAAIFAALWFIATSLNLGTIIVAPLTYISVINALLGGFNLLPAFPLDGGRVLRAGLWKWKNNLITATWLSSKISSLIAYGMMGIGFLSIFYFSMFTGLWLIFIGWFIKNGAESSFKQAIIGQVLTDVNVDKIMNRRVKSIPPNLTVSAAVEDYFEKFTHGGYPVTEDEKILGMVTISDVRRVAPEDRDKIKVEDIMIPKEKVVFVSPDEQAVEALVKLSKHDVGRLPVLKGDRLVGIVTRSDIMKLIRTRTEFQSLEK